MAETRKRKTAAQLRKEENEELGDFIQLDTIPGGVIDTTPRDVRERCNRAMKALAARNKNKSTKAKKK